MKNQPLRVSKLKNVAAFKIDKNKAHIWETWRSQHNLHEVPFRNLRN